MTTTLRIVLKNHKDQVEDDLKSAEVSLRTKMNEVEALQNRVDKMREDLEHTEAAIAELEQS